MTSEKLQDKYNLVLTDPAIKELQDKLTEEFLDWYLKVTGRPEDYLDQRQYFEIMSFVLLGWVAHEAFIIEGGWELR